MINGKRNKQINKVIIPTDVILQKDIRCQYFGDGPKCRINKPSESLDL